MYIHVCVKIQLFLKIQFSTFFDITWYAKVAIYIKKVFFLSFHSLLFLVNNAVDVIEYDKVWHRWMEWKMSLCERHTFWKTPWLNCSFIVALFYAKITWRFLRNLATVFHLKSKWSGISAFQSYWWKYRNAEK